MGRTRDTGGEKERERGDGGMMGRTRDTGGEREREREGTEG